MDYESAPQEGAVSSVGGIPRFTVTLLDAAYSATRSVILDNSWIAALIVKLLLYFPR